MQRRNFLKIIGGGVVVAAAASTGFALTRTPGDALMPWQMAGDSQYADPRLRALSYAILAPNPHNRQPWKVALESDDTVRLHVDLDRLLPHTDPFSRQITIGLGCFLELMAMAAAGTGHKVKFDLFPEGTDSARLTTAPVAVARFVANPAIKPEPLFAHVMARRSNKEPFDTTRPVPDAALAVVLASGRYGGALGGTNAPDEVEDWRQLTEEALQIEIDTPRTYKESVDLFRIGKAEVNANPDGIDFSGPMFESLALIGQFSREVALDRSSMGFQQGQAAVIENTRTAMAFAWMTTAGNSRADQIAAGRDWLRCNLAATGQGLGFQPLSQALQEYHEMVAIYRDVHTMLAPEGGTVQMLVRLGYGPEIAVSPRWPLEAKLMEA